ncbi:MAG TPA: phosphopyruvate hydratase [Pirellulales bacterium]|nr:phosphopyruvate hydratase [Pirellulales bacterium]
MTTISNVIAREVLDSRGDPTVEAEVHTSGGVWGRAIVPSGASTGAAEACELRDRTAARYDGRGVLEAVAHVRDTIGPAVLGLDPADQAALDAQLLELDDSPQKTRLGGNALLAVSLAGAHAGAASNGIPLYRHLNDVFRRLDPSAPQPRMPLAMINMISGGLHAGGNLDFQDFLIMPIGAENITLGFEWAVRVYRRLGSLLTAAGFEGRLVADEGGYGPRLGSNGQAAEFVVRAIEAAGFVPGRDVTLAVDVASTHFFDGSQYRLAATGDDRLTSDQMIDYLEAMVEQFPITSIEDGLAEDDWSGWQQLTTRLGKEVRLVGDDLFATNAARLERGIQLGGGNSVLIKVNQIGTLTETLRTIGLARKHGYSYVVSARSGETEDTTIADLAVATAADLIKIGSIARSERLAKYNQLLRISEGLR